MPKITVNKISVAKARPRSLPGGSLSKLLAEVRLFCSEKPGRRVALARAINVRPQEISTYLSERARRRPNGEKALDIRAWYRAMRRSHEGRTNVHQDEVQLIKPEKMTKFEAWKIRLREKIAQTL